MVSQAVRSYGLLDLNVVEVHIPFVRVRVNEATHPSILYSFDMFEK
jgi:hypothetical protein